MTYFVVLPDGQKFGPADEQLLNQWVVEGRILPGTMLEDSMTGRQLPASSIPSLQLAQQPQAPTPPQDQPAPGQPYAGYYRGGMVDTGNNDLTLSYVFGSLGLVMCAGNMLCGLCGLVGVVFPILGLVFAKNAEKKGHPGFNGARILCWIGVALQILAMLGYIGLITLGMIAS